jgi:hypothetical protein
MIDLLNRIGFRQIAFGGEVVAAVVVVVITIMMTMLTIPTRMFTTIMATSK